MADPGTPRGSVLKDVVAYVEVWSANGTENYSKTFTNQLVEMGAKVSKTFNKQVTHVVFKDGHQRTWDKAQKRGVKLVSVLWVEKCRTAGAHVDEALFPAASAHERLPCLVKKKLKCMQPKDFIPKTPENNKRLQRKFEKMANELQKQKRTLDDEAPVLLFESSGALSYSPTVAQAASRRCAMERRLQEMKEKRENLSPTSSQMIEESCDCPVTSACEASLNVSQDSLCSDDSFAGALQLSFDSPCGHSGRGDQRRRAGGLAEDSERDGCASSLARKTCSDHASASPWSLWQPPLHRAAPPLPEEEVDGPRGPAGEMADPHEKQSQGALTVCGEDGGLSPVPSGRPRPRGPLAKRKRTSEHPASPLEEGPGGKKCGRRSPATSPWLREAEKGLRHVTWPAAEPLDPGASYDDYFSPENLKERSSEMLPPGHPSPASPAGLRCRAGLSRRARRSILYLSDLSHIGESPAPGGTTCLQKHGGAGPETPVGAVAAGAPQVTQEKEDTCPGGNPKPTGPGTSRGDCMSPGGSQEEAAGLGSTQEDATSRAVQSPTGVRTSPSRRSDAEGRWASGRDLIGSHEERRTRGKGRKPTRTLVMTSLPSEKQSIVLRVVAQLKGFSLAREVCESTTHVLVGTARRTLSVLQGIARGCWVLAYEWVLWSLELGRWMSEEPFELSDSFPAAPLCRQERHLSAEQYQGTLFAGQPVMFISPASDPPRAKLGQLVRLCGGRVTGVPRQAGIFVGPCPWRRKETATCLSEKWVLDSITQHQVCAHENYLLQ